MIIKRIMKSEKWKINMSLNRFKGRIGMDEWFMIKLIINLFSLKTS